ncbi:MAG TPA: hypothetical protein VKF39_01920 [Nitrososphaerales archaeon]|nr:hypothetical protein [Nitrososphaerales archaeon]
MGTALDTSQVMRLALDIAGFDKIPTDSGIWVPGRGIKRALFSVDAGPSEVILAKQAGYDLLIGHHPVGPARLTFSSVVMRHIDFMLEKKVPRREAEEAVRELITRIDVKAHASNYMHDVEFARTMKMPYMNIHLPIDQITRDFLLAAISKSKARTVGGLIRDLSRIPEFRDARTKIELRMGNDADPLGKWVLLFAAGTNGGYPVAKTYYEHGMDTVIYLHIDPEELLKLRKEHLGNLIILGHMAGDSIGINIFLRELRKRGVACDTIGVIH